MRAKLGVLTIAVAALFGVGLLLSTARAAWQPNLSHNGILGFFGFGVPMAALAWATVALWDSNNERQLVFGWVCVLFGLAWALGLFVLIADWTNIIAIRHEPVGGWEGIALFAGFVVPMALCGGTGIAVVIQSNQTPPTGT